MNNIIKLTVGLICFGLWGCANEPALGVAKNQLRAEQTLNPEAWHENLGYLSEGSGERTQASLKVYNNNGVAKKNK
ncbi:hypothetical protein ONE56_10135 [Vibrio mytili]|uniref:hypothetical protein n=1 Tax=Vibrio mytili TaxID=50718 RepID=UPI003C6F8EDA